MTASEPFAGRGESLTKHLTCDSSPRFSEITNSRSTANGFMHLSYIKVPKISGVSQLDLYLNPPITKILIAFAIKRV